MAWGTLTITLREGLRVNPLGQSETEMHAILLPNSVDAEVLDRLSAQFSQMPQVHQAFWNQSAGE